MSNKIDEIFNFIKEKLNIKEKSSDIISNQINRTWDKGPCWRKFLLWGTDSENNPSYVVFYGLHFCKEQSDEFADDVIYTNYIVFRGKEGHMPSFESTKIFDISPYRSSEKDFKLYYKKDCNIWYPKHNCKDKYIKEFIQLDKTSFKVPYFINNSYEDYYNVAKNIEFENFTLSKNPKDVFILDSSLDFLYDLFSSPNIYTRKKTLKQILSVNPPKGIYDYFLKIGSCELISGLFLELANSNNDILLEQAKQIQSSKLTWDSESYINGLKRCASIYVNCFENKDERIAYLRDSVKDFGLELCKKKDISFKNVIQEAEIYKLTDVIGKIACGLDSYNIRNTFNWSSRQKALRYYISYLKRIIKHYAKTNEILFMEVMLNIFANYTKNSSLSSDSFARTYLNDDFAGFKNIWNNNLDYVIDIACKSTNDYVLQAMFNILNEGANKTKLLNIDYDKLINLASCINTQLQTIAFNALKVKLNKETIYNPDIMYLLMKSTSTKVQELSVSYYKLAAGNILLKDLINFTLLGDICVDILKEGLETISLDQYISYLHEVISYSIANSSIEFTDNIKEVIKNSIYKLQNLDINQKAELLSTFIKDTNNNMPVFINELIEDIVFNYSLDELCSILDMIQIDTNNLYSSFMGALLTSIKNKTIPNDGILLELFERGSANIVKCLVEISIQNKNTLENRQATLLLFMECDILALNNLAIEIFENTSKDKQKALHVLFLDSPVGKVHNFAIKKLYEIYEEKGEYIPQEFLLKMLEHTSKEVKKYVSEKINDTILNLGNGDKNLFVYYTKTILLMPNKLSKAKKNIYNILPKFVNMYNDKKTDIEEILLNVGSSNIILDSENALTTLAKIKMGVI